MQLIGIGTAVPKFSILQADAAAFAQHMGCENDAQRKFLKEIYAHSGVSTRHSVLLTSFDGRMLERQSFFHASTCAEDRGPTTAQRMQVYAEAGPPLAAAAAQRALIDAHVAAADITHLVTASCTGFGAPGVDAALIERLPLRPSVSRTHLGFMGCHAALNALRVAQAYTSADRAATVLIVAVELCSLHHQYSGEPQAIISNALFADGAAAVVARADDHAGERDAPAWRLAASSTTVLPDSAGDMTWTIGDHGFEMSLSRRVPELIRSQLRPWLDNWLAENQLTRAQVGSWAIHPGGPRILQAAADACDIARAALAVSDDILARYGNMSSPTILFLLEELRRSRADRPCVALAFGPGLTIEAALLV